MLTADPIADGVILHVLAARIDAAVAIAFKDRMRRLTEAGSPAGWCWTWSR